MMKNHKVKEMRGVTFLHSETGTEGGWWAMQEDDFVTEDGHWGYEGLQCLEEGDDFTVFAEEGSVLWHGIIHPDSKSGRISRQVIRKGKLVEDRTRNSKLLAECGYIGFRRIWIPRLGESSSTAIKDAYSSANRNFNRMSRGADEGDGVHEEEKGR